MLFRRETGVELSKQTTKQQRATSRWLHFDRERSLEVMPSKSIHGGEKPSDRPLGPEKRSMAGTGSIIPNSRQNDLLRDAHPMAPQS